MKRYYPAFLLLIFFTVLVMLFGVTGCSTLLKLQGQSAEKASQAIAFYCKNTDQLFREKFRAEINSKALPNQITIYCDGDK